MFIHKLPLNFVLCSYRSYVPHQYANQWGGPSGGQLQDRGSFQGTVCYVSSR